MYLLDTSVWVDYLRGRDRPHVGFLRCLLSSPIAVGITHLIYMEILEGARDAAAFDRLQSCFGGQRLHSFKDLAANHASAARLYLDRRRHGIDVRSAADCLIARCALESGLILFHHDRDLERIASVVPALVERSFLHRAPRFADPSAAMEPSPMAAARAAPRLPTGEAALAKRPVAA